MAPSEFWEMPLLRHARLYNFELPDPPHGEHNFDLENLHTLSCVRNLRFSEEVVKRISNVRKLKVMYKCTGVDWKDGLTDFCFINLGRLQKLESLNLDMYQCDLIWSVRGISMFSLPKSLKKLSLSGTLLSWEEVTAKIGSLPLLQLLRLNWEACSGPKWETVEGQFPSLRVLQIERCNDLKYWDTDSTHFPRLDQLRLPYLPELEEIPSSIGDIPTLKLIQLEWCSKSAHDFYSSSESPSSSSVA